MTVIKVCKTYLQIILTHSVHNRFYTSWVAINVPICVFTKTWKDSMSPMLWMFSMLRTHFLYENIVPKFLVIPFLRHLLRKSQWKSHFVTCFSLDKCNGASFFSQKGKLQNILTSLWKSMLTTNRTLLYIENIDSVSV